MGIVIERKEADHNRRGTFSAQSLLIPYELCIRLTETLLRINRIFLSLVSLEEGGERGRETKR